ncbi:DUF4166 domain-containing protein [Kitasatospora sp. NPDC088391]|uniref:DUF4166 domain-containing protein n=1 Tax=Kitasatospora sp. NPDC088391 TaxID=3364074 RepID=UPI00382DF878
MTVTLFDSPVPAADFREGSIFRAALGSEFERLHPELQRRFGFSTADGIACVGTGRMERIERGPGVVAPFLRLGTRRNILFPEHGRDVPFTIANYAYRDGFGRETVTFVRTFQFVRPRRFDATMVAAPGRPGAIVDYLGTHQHLAVDLRLGVTEQGGLVISSGAQRVASLVGAPLLPAAVTGRADLHEGFDERAGRFRIRVRVTNPVVGLVLGYQGWFTAEYPRVGPEGVPSHVRPVRESFRL